MFLQATRFLLLVKSERRPNAKNRAFHSIAKDYLPHNIRCNCISPARVHTPFVDNYLKQNYPGQEEEMYEQLSKTQPIGRMAKPIEIANLARYLCSEEASFITGTNVPIDGGFIKLNT